MNKATKNITTIILAASMILLTIFVGTFAVFAENAQEIVSKGTWGGIDWTLSADGTLTIVPTDNEITDARHGNTSKLYERGQIPCGANLAWTVYYAPWPKSDVKSLVIEEGVTSIGTFAFYDYPNLEGELVIPSTVNYIGQEAIKSTKLTKLIFASGGTEALTIAQGGLNNNAYLEEVVFPEDRPEIHLKAWILNSCDSLTHLFFPANVKSMGGTNSLDYKNFSTNHSAGNHSALTYYCDKLEAITFGSEEVKNLFFNTWGNPITTIGNKNSYTTPAKAAFVGLTYCTSFDAAVKYAKPGETITLMKNITVSEGESFEIPSGITLDMAEKTITNNGTIFNYGEITGLGEITNNNEGVLLTSKDSIDASINITGNTLECTVTLDYGETNIPSQTIQTINGYLVFELSNPDFAGYVFLGWYADAEFTTEFDFTQFITKDTTIYAKLGDYESDKNSLNDAIDAAKNDLQSQMDNVNAKLNDKANISDLTEAVADLNTVIAKATATLEAADTANKSELTEKIKSANAALAVAIMAIQQNLDDAKNELMNAINENKIDIEGKIASLQVALASSRVALAVADSARSELTKKIEEADTTLYEAVKVVQQNLDDAKNELLDAINANEIDIEDKVANLKAALDSSKAALEVADTANKSELAKKVEDADATLEAAIKLLQNNVEELKKQLEKTNGENKSAFDKIEKLQTFVIIVSVVSGVAFCGSGTLAAFYLADKKKR